MLFNKLFLFALLTTSYHGTNGDAEVEKVKKLLTYKLDQMRTHFERNLQLIKDEMSELKVQTSNHTCTEGWIPFSDTKCYKVIEKKKSELLAKEECSKLYTGSTLITIDSESEQTFLENLLIKYNEISDNVWIGLEANGEVVVSQPQNEPDQSRNVVDSEEEEEEPNVEREVVNKTIKTYKWIDENDLPFDNWDENADKKKDCVQMSLSKSTLGKWIDNSCTKKCLVVCQTKQWTPTVVSHEIHKMSRVMKDQKNVISRQETEINQLRVQLNEKPKDDNQGIPIGFIYTQLPEQSKPEELWPKTNWSDITSEYSGLFFRAEGEGSEPFGEIQAANQSWISDIYFKGGYFSFFNNQYYYEKIYSTKLAEEKWKDINHDVGVVTVHTLKFYTTEGEVRPRNTAVKIWKRIL